LRSSLRASAFPGFTVPSLISSASHPHLGSLSSFNNILPSSYTQQPTLHGTHQPATMTQSGHARQKSHKSSSPVVMADCNNRPRPVRDGAGKRKSDSDFVDSGIIEDDDDDLEWPDTEDESDTIRVPLRKRQRRSPSPEIPLIDPIIYDEEEPDISDIEDTQGKNLVLKLNLEKGCHGPLTIVIDNSTLATFLSKETTQMTSPEPQQETQVPAAPSSTNNFARLPPELRNQIYDSLFKATEGLQIHNPHNFCRSAQFLRTCKMVHVEGASVLYGKNQFVFRRVRNRRGPFWEMEPKEVGYQDVRRFLNMIGPVNLGYLRDIKLMLEDASPGMTPYLDHESRRYVNDLQLMACLRTLRNARLEKLSLNFWGRRALLKTDVRFVDYLKRVQADEVDVGDMRAFYHDKIEYQLRAELKEAMTRQVKLYTEAPETAES
jgi:hypothetical protein